MCPSTSEQIAMRFDGATFEYDRDGKRLGAQMRAVMKLLLHDWKRTKVTLWQIARETGYPEASISARLRDMRKPRFGSHDVRREYIGNGLHVYWVEA